MTDQTIQIFLSKIPGYCTKIVAAILILTIGLWVAKRARVILIKMLTRKSVDETLVRFFANILQGIIFVLVAVAAISKLGIETTSFAAVIASAGLAIGLALQGSLSNFAAGVLLILFKPFKVGDSIKAGNETGIVKEIGLLTTELKTYDNLKLVIPNAIVMNGAITNFSANSTRRIDLVIGVGYGDDLNKAKQLILDLIAQDERILKDPEPQVLVCLLYTSDAADD